MDQTQSADERDVLSARLAAALPAYEIGPILGRGAFAVVFAARHRTLGREVAIKRLSPDLLRESEARHRFAAEARLLASLDHFHIVRVYDYVEEEEVCAFVMERMHGGTLADRQALGQASRPWAIAVVLGALYGLEHAHQKGVLHRDIKPENLLFDEGSHVKVADFGIAKVVGAQGARLTATAAAIGTPAYMAPEQVTRSAGPLSAATDVWQTGAVLYELVAREPPFPRSGELGEILFERATAEPRPVQEVAPDVPDDLAEVIMRSLRRDPRERYHTAAAFAAALEPAAERAAGPGGLAATGVPIHRTAPRAHATTEPPTPLPAPSRARPRRSRRLVVAVVAIAALAAVAGLVALLTSSGSDKGGRPQAAALALPPAPAGWPKALTASYVDQVSGSAGVARRLGRGATASNVFYGDAAAKKDWSHDPSQPRPAAFVRDAARRGLFPYAILYSLRALGQSGRGDDASAPELRQTLTNPRLMRIYWTNVRHFLRDLGAAKRPVAVSLDSNFWSYLEQHLANRGERPSSVPARVGLSGLPELKGIPDNLIGFAKGWRTLRDRYAPQARLGYEFDDWASGSIDISRDDPARATTVDAARQAAEFYLTVAANDLDFAALTVDGDGTEEGQNPSATYVYSTAEKNRVVDFVREFVRVADVPMVLEGVPLGNTVSQAITDKPFHWRDSWVQWLVGTDRFAGMRRLRDAGVIGTLFGVSFGEGETCPCDAAHDGVTNGGRYARPSTAADDDGGYFRDRMRALGRAGGLPLT